MRCHPVPDKPWPLSVSERNRCCLSGEMGSGKSSLVLRYVKGQFFDYQVRCGACKDTQGPREEGARGGGQLDLGSAGLRHAVKATICRQQCVVSARRVTHENPGSLCASRRPRSVPRFLQRLCQT